MLMSCTCTLHDGKHYEVGELSPLWIVNYTGLWRTETQRGFLSGTVKSKLSTLLHSCTVSGAVLRVLIAGGRHESESQDLNRQCCPPLVTR
jgi:hypothetical protein